MDSALGRFWRVATLLAAALVGFGLILWVAANWDDFGRMGRFALLQALIAVALLGAWARPALRAPLGLVALLGIGGLFAYFGQTYQTGADPWQLFALWAVLALPLALAVRHDLLWAPWALVAMTAVSLWTQTHTGHSWRVLPQDLPVHASAWLAAAAIAACVSPLARRTTGAGIWAWRMAATLFVVVVTLTAVGGLFKDEIAPHYPLGLALLLACALWFGSRRGFDVFAFSAVALGLNGLLLAGLARWLFDADNDALIGKLLLMGLASAALLALSVQWTLRRTRSGLPPPATAPATQPQALPQTERPWPLVLLTALGAWLAALPLLGIVGLLLGDSLRDGVALYIAGGLLLALACMLLRALSLSVFVEQLAVPLLLAGGGTLGLALARDLPPPAAAALLAGLALLVAAFGSGQRRWLQALLGAAAANACTVALLPDAWRDVDLGDGPGLWWALHGAMLVWLAALAMQQRLAGHAQAGLQAIAAGWLLSTVAALALASGMGFLAGGVLGHAGSELAAEVGSAATRGLALQVPAIGSVLLALAAAAVAARAWPALRQAGCAGAALVIAALCSFLPTLGVVLLALSLMAARRHLRLAAACALAAAWIVGSFYYQLAWPLASKAVVLVVCGVALAALARWAHRATPATVVTPTAVRRAGLSLAVCGIATLAVANGAIWQKQQLIAHGQPLYVALAPVDPRSLMQGDFMRLRFELPEDPEDERDRLWRDQRPMVMAQRDARGVAVLQRIADPQQPPAPGELRIQLTPKDGNWVLVTDAWFFREGEAERFAQARFGEFRVGPDGRALLVGMADAQLQPIR